MSSKVIKSVLDKMHKYAEEQDAAEFFDQYIQDQLKFAEREYNIKVQSILSEKEKYELTRKKKMALDAVKDEDKAVKEQEKQKKEEEKQQAQQAKEMQQQVALPYPSIGGSTSQGTNALADPAVVQAMQKTSSSSNTLHKVIYALRKKKGMRSK